MKKKHEFSGFETISVDSLKEYRAQGIHLLHLSTGAEIYQVATSDEENLFSFAFRTPPANHSGVAHILEHAVLCGSHSYPLKDPFRVLLKGSAHTFLNAMTFPDKTVYPASSTVKADFLNLMRVYGDAVFFPQLKREVFEQEGHHLEYNNEGRLIRVGIVFNEMKGSYSSCESIAGDWALRSLFPDSPYNWDSGGDPRFIPSLSYQEFKEFHATWYHPSNLRIFLYGNYNLDELLTILDGEFLSRFQRRDIPSAIPLQPRWNQAGRLCASWPSAPDEPTLNKSTISLNWMLGESTKPDAVLNARVLSFILLGHGGAPLHKAIIDSGIGEDISPVSGLETDLRQMMFSAAVRGSNPEKEKDFESLVLSTLNDLVKNGLNRDLVEGALRSVEFHGREIRGGTPFGLRLMMRALRGWLHNRPPLESLAFDEPMDRLRQAVKPGYFEDIIRRDLLANPHRTTVVVSPDPHMQRKQDAEERVELDSIQRVLEEGGAIGDITKDTLRQSLDRLSEFQNQPDSSEDLARIPYLSRSDLPSKVLHLPLKEGRHAELSWYRHETFSNGVAYLDMAFDLAGLDPKLHGWLPLFGRALTELGLPSLSHDELSRELAMKTGGLDCSLDASRLYPASRGELSLRFFVHLKALFGQWEEALELTSRLLVSADFTNLERIGDLLLEQRNEYRSTVLPSGNAFAALRASSKHSSVAAWENLWYGIDQLLFLQNLMDAADAAKQASVALMAIQESLIRCGRLSLVVTSDSDVAEHALASALKMTDSLKGGQTPAKGEPHLFRHPTRGESLSVASAVTFSALSLPGPMLGTPEHAQAGLLAHILRTGYLWKHIRVKGGAYGASASLVGSQGIFNFSTYRDPNIVSSLKSFQAALEWATENLDDETVDMAVIAVIGKELRPLSPGERGFIAFKRKLYGITDELRQMRRDFLLRTDADSVRNQASTLLGEWEKRSVSVIANADALDEAIAHCPELVESRVVVPT